MLDRASFATADGLARGAYVLREAALPPPADRKVGLIVAAEALLRQRDLRVRLVVDAELLEATARRCYGPPWPSLAVGAGIAQGWHRYVGPRGEVISVDRFGGSAAGAVVLDRHGFTAEQVCQRARPYCRGPAPP